MSNCNDALFGKAFACDATEGYTCNKKVIVIAYSSLDDIYEVKDLNTLVDLFIDHDFHANVSMEWSFSI